ncbi:hypothetical protein GCM10023320_40700 [Pseudonocardia adelaidensis]|uniref:Uncharacterized protein n=1 Tax=Pseudonocardia adelaidensis TaxID=648754 RepID=A0ABP9NLB6_9PSEU
MPATQTIAPTDVTLLHRMAVLRLRRAVLAPPVDPAAVHNGDENARLLGTDRGKGRKMVSNTASDSQ